LQRADREGLENHGFIVGRLVGLPSKSKGRPRWVCLLGQDVRQIYLAGLAGAEDVG
jgi:hypothetical protein